MPLGHDTGGVGGARVVGTLQIPVYFCEKNIAVCNDL